MDLLICPILFSVEIHFPSQKASIVSLVLLMFPHTLPRWKHHPEKKTSPYHTYHHFFISPFFLVSSSPTFLYHPDLTQISIHHPPSHPHLAQAPHRGWRQAQEVPRRATQLGGALEPVRHVDVAAHHLKSPGFQVDFKDKFSGMIQMMMLCGYV